MQEQGQLWQAVHPLPDWPASLCRLTRYRGVARVALALASHLRQATSSPEQKGPLEHRELAGSKPQAHTVQQEQSSSLASALPQSLPKPPAL